MARPPIPTRPAPLNVPDQVQNRNNEGLHRRISELADGMNAMAGRLIGRTVLTSTGRYTPSAGATLAVVLLCGGGGGGGGAGTGANVACGAGGGSGVTVELLLSDPAASDVVIGTGGSGGSSTGGNGANGVGSTLRTGGTTYTAAGGGGGAGLVSQAGSSVAVVTDVVPGTSTTTSVTSYQASLGTQGIVIGGTAALPGDGGSGRLGIGGIGAHTSFADGGPGRGNGAGGGGANAAGTGGHRGGSGAPGVCIIDEYG